MFSLDSTPLLVGGLLAGIVFGFLLQKGGVARYATIVGQFLWVDHTVLRVMLTAIVVGSIGVYGMLGLGLIDHLQIKPALLAANLLGGLIFGVGMSTAGYCPGTGVAALGEGSRHAAWVVLGMIAGAGAYAASFPILDAALLHVGDFGKVSLSDVTGLPPVVFIVGLALVSLAVFAALPRQAARAA